MRLAICLLVVLLIATPAFASDWNMFKKDLSHSGFTIDTVNPPLTLKWTYDLGYDTESSPVIVGNVLYVGSNYGIHAIDVDSGKELWRTSTDGFVKAVPTVVDGVLYVGPYARQFVAIDIKDGTIKWDYKNTTGGYLHSAAVVNNLVYVATDGTFYALNVQTGEPAWLSLIGRVSESSPAIADGLIVFGTDKGLIVALDATSRMEKWHYGTGIADVVSSPLIANGTIFIASNDGNIYALTMNGVLKWKYSTGNNVKSSPSIKDGTVFVGSQDSNLYAIDAQTGAPKWKFMAGGYVDSSPAISNNVVYFGARSNMIYALDADTGRVLWRNTTGPNQKDYITSPAISGNMLYAVTSGGRVLAFSGAQVTPAATATPVITASPTATATPVSTTASPNETRSTPGFEFSIIILLMTIAIIKRWGN
jgi:outer membrane protein assembly factor BamB